jgi:sugar O-acyltransferase (sialic acid O-acetyltransferase NeuD family)
MARYLAKRDLCAGARYNAALYGERTMTSVRTWVVVGAGGHAAVVVATIQAAGESIRVVLDDNPRAWGSDVLGVPVTGPVVAAAIRAGAVAVLAVGSNRARRDLARRLPLAWGVAIHPSAIIHSSVEIGEGTVIFAGAIVQPRTRIGRHAIVNTAASVDHDGLLEDFVHIAPGARLSGNVTVREGALMGVGSAAIPGTTVGAWAIVGGGGAVVSDVPPGATALGVPALPREASS